MFYVQLGLEPEFDQGAANVESWLKVPKQGSRTIFEVASEALKVMN